MLAAAALAVAARTAACAGPRRSGKVRQHFQLQSTALLGHSWGAVLALEYVLRHPTRVSHLILMNPAPASASDVAV
jgi:pimeloyl-ACP methyl ester carboxylesterase